MQRISRAAFSLFFAVAAVLALSSCSAVKGPLYPDVKRSGALNPGKHAGLVFIYSNTLPSKMRFKVYANNKLVSTTMGCSKFIYMRAEPGALHLSSTCLCVNPGLDILLLPEPIFCYTHRKIDRIVLNIEPGKTYYIDMHNGCGREVMDQVDKSEGEAKIQGCHWAETPETPLSAGRK